MDVKYINPFIEATRDFMEVMVGAQQFERRSLSAEEIIKTHFDISAIIGIAGMCRGSVVLSFTKEIAFKILASIIGEEIDEMDKDACDAVGEMVNIIAGNAISAIMKTGVGTVERSVPNIINGKGHKVAQPTSIPCINIIFSTDLGDFAMQVSFINMNEVGGESTSPSG